MRSQRVGHGWATFTPLHFHGQPTWGLEKTTCTDLQVTSPSESTQQPSYQEKRRRPHLGSGGGVGMWSLTKGYRTGVPMQNPLLPRPWDPGEAPSLTKWKGVKIQWTRQGYSVPDTTWGAVLLCMKIPTRTVMWTKQDNVAKSVCMCEREREKCFKL